MHLHLEGIDCRNYKCLYQEGIDYHNYIVTATLNHINHIIFYLEETHNASFQNH